MSIKSSAFGGVTLTGKDAKKFVAQVQKGKPNSAAAPAVARGVKMAKAYAATGVVKIRMKDGKFVHAE
ncbi:hypothetical protein ACFFTN_01560 [Aminobacter aganoensis]|uniref:Uncharacterized protein n=1 Tax=Aminobacter aganoensis TaxID=83264 RepID=A0A7X0F5J5_9HYPH|nr:hypothetical protein [Aminobacter aganoensis]MBB6353450.1 hypothetical protein [Aminobacter aganoensis]